MGVSGPQFPLRPEPNDGHHTVAGPSYPRGVSREPTPHTPGIARVSVVVATFNVAGTVEACLESVLGQEGADVELLVADGASTDGTRA